ncbi:MAG: LysM peptidoglycan-binding domain-containing protein [Bacteroidetes bacterium]|nr:LysM peptidoglycan-binding domain-containing protein [Bacteroidota bacterium]
MHTSGSGFAMSDSVRVRWIEGKKFILHKVELKQTWSLLAKKYNCSIKELKEANVGVEELKTGQIINVPVITSSDPHAGSGTKVTQKKTEISEPVKTSVAPAKNSSKDKTAVYHIVKHGETLYSISKMYNQTVDEIKSLNKLTNNAVKDGQKLIVQLTKENGNGPSALPVTATPFKTETKKTESVVPETQTAKTTAVTSNPAKEETKSAPAVLAANNFERATKTISPIKKANGGKTLMQVNETGVATWILDGQINQDKYYGLHRNAPIGTIIKVTNRMNNQFVYVKIVGVLPDTGDNDNVIIKVSQAVSTKLNALDALFQVELSYGVMQ